MFVCRCACLSVCVYVCIYILSDAESKNEINAGSVMSIQGSCTFFVVLFHKGQNVVSCFSNTKICYRTANVLSHPSPAFCFLSGSYVK